MITSLKQSKRVNPQDDYTFISSDSEQADFQESQSLSRVQDQADTVDIAQFARKDTHIRQPRFVSISQYYEALVTSSIQQSSQCFNSRKSIYLEETSYYECFCLKRLKMAYHFVAHIEHCHGLEVQSLDYLRGRQTLKIYGLDSKQFKLTESQYLQKIQAKHYSQLVFPEEIRLLGSSKLRAYVKKKLKALLFLAVPVENFYSNAYKLALSHPKPHLFSREFMQDIRNLLTRYMSIFDRRVDIYVKNMSLRQGLWTLLWSLEGTFWQAKKESFAKRSRNKPIFDISNLIQCICRHFLAWVDSSFMKVLQKNSIYYSHIELEQNQRYSEVARMWKCDLFAQEYLRHIQSKYVGETIFQFVQLFVEVLEIYSKQITETETNIFMMAEQKVT